MAGEGVGSWLDAPIRSRAPKAQGVARRESAVAELMRRAGARAATARRFVARAAGSRHGHGVAGNAPDRGPEPGEVDRVWAGDITYIAAGGGWPYLASVLDPGGREVIGRAAADHLRGELAGRARRYACDAHREPTGPRAWRRA
jgi:putative transposase